MRRSLIAGLVAAPVIALTTLAIVTSGSADAEGATLAAGKFRAYQPGATAITYDPVQVPAGARAAVVSTDLTNATVRLVVTGLQPNRSYGAHAHNNACGATGTDAGSHFQYLIDPEQPSVNPAYANPDNEIWLDFHTDAFGNGVAVSRHGWSFGDLGDRRPHSVVIHAEETHTDPGHAGQAGARLACITVPL